MEVPGKSNSTNSALDSSDGWSFPVFVSQGEFSSEERLPAVRPESPGFYHLGSDLFSER